MAIGLALGGAHLVAAAASTRARGTERFLDDLLDHVAAHPERRFVFSSRVARDLRTAHRAFPPNAREGMASLFADDERLAFYASEGMPLVSWPANRPGLAEAQLGAADVTFDYYPSWKEDRIVVMAARTAKALGMRP
jgi:hypothetical protein